MPTRRRIPGALAALALLGGCASSTTGRVDATSSTTAGASRAVSDGLRMIEAAGDGRLTEVQQLLKKGAEVHAVDDEGRTALIAAAYGGHLDVARALVAAGADVNVQDSTKQSAYLIATSEIGEAKGLELLELTLGHGADVTTLDSYHGTGLIRAADRGFADIVARLLQTPIDKDHVNRLGWTALLEAIILGNGDTKHVEVVRRLVAAGVDVNRADGSGVTPLAHARDKGYQEMDDLLTAAGAR